MKLEDVLKLRPAAGSDAATIGMAIRTAEAKRREMLAAAKAAQVARRDVLAADDKAISAAERDGKAAELAAERIGQILPRLRTDLAEAEARELRAALLAEHAGLEAALAPLRQWAEQTSPAIARLIGEGLAAQDAAETALHGFLASVTAAYDACAELRDAGPLGVTLPGLPDTLPRTTFPGWNR